jgi:hypothetical protein
MCKQYISVSHCTTVETLYLLSKRLRRLPVKRDPNGGSNNKTNKHGSSLSKYSKCNDIDMILIQYLVLIRPGISFWYATLLVMHVWHIGHIAIII